MQNPEDRIRKTESGRQKIYSFSSVCALCSFLFALSLTGCATPASKLPPPPPKYVNQTEEAVEVSSINSLWNEKENLFEDRKARRLNDLVTINIDESFSGSGKADTATSRESSIDFELAKFLGMNKDFNLQNAFGIKDLYKGANVFDPAVKSTSKSAFKGKGDTNREGTLVATITAKVVEVMPNGNLVLEARKELTINSEKQILVLSGMVRPDDISSDNTIASSKIADAQVYYVGDGVIQEKQSPGWMVRTLDYVWPF
ncbi:MAG TPA: flagellar basal body L-ring protein FlgH [Nitrospirae bacterium]|nr:flagellar L-ring protein precursor [bacterium BMS3Abin06]HDH13235.1 flagellar basal body L-ring protein FlgH [Nitrospirota bacterium]HDZ01797.1 flagellar basal body L-ring protein FlgH [Nitrospirota bacterium]